MIDRELINAIQKLWLSAAHLIKYYLKKLEVIVAGLNSFV